MKRVMCAALGLAGFVVGTSAFALDYQAKSLLVYSARYAFQGQSDGLLPASEAVADYMESLPKGGALIAKKYTCNVKMTMAAMDGGQQILLFDMLYDVKDCQAAD